MEETIKKILQIEADAQAITAEARQMHKHFEDDMAEMTSEIQSHIKAQADQQVAKMQAFERAALETEKTELLKQTAEKRAALDALYRQKKDEWSEALFLRIIGR